MGDLGRFSFYPTRTWRGREGGMVTTNNPDYARTLSLLRNWAKSAATIRSSRLQLPAAGHPGGDPAREIGRLEQSIKPGARSPRRTTTDCCGILRRPRPRPCRETRPVYCLYTIRAENRDEVQRGLAGAEIQTHGPLSHSDSPYACLRRYEVQAGGFPVAEASASTVSSLPLSSDAWAQVDQ